ncbi:patellin-4-like [Diospyros lotus]|uniref:patellin-4-like n=1 Tax=Diospyros lotus TaxID=55363 RepID=UPI0022591F51|nr:patellin-4-like [Diospyros lotus]
MVVEGTTHWMAEVAVSQEQEANNINNASIVSKEAKSEEQNGESKKDEKPKTEESAEEKAKNGEEAGPALERNGTFKEDSNLKEHEKQALSELRSLLECAIHGNRLVVETNDRIEEEPEPSEKKKDKTSEDEAAAGKEEMEKDNTTPATLMVEERVGGEKDVRLWGVPLLPSKGERSTDVILLKFLRAREFKVNEAFEMLKTTLQWRKEFKIESVLEEDFGAHLGSAFYISGADREGRPVCYNLYGVFAGSDEMYRRTFGREEKNEKFLRWRAQLMERAIQKLDFGPGGVSSLFQINDLNKTPGPASKDLWLATKQAVSRLQDNYPELVAKNIFINVPFWYYAFSALVSPFFTQRTRNRVVFARPAKVTETLLRYIDVEQIPAQYGGFKRKNDTEFSGENEYLEFVVKASSSETIEFPAAKVGTSLVWDVTVVGWEVNYREEFVPDDKGSYALIVQRGRKIGCQEEAIRNSFTNKEPGKVVITIDNDSYKKKRIIYRYKAKNV